MVILSLQLKQNMLSIQVVKCITQKSELENPFHTHSLSAPRNQAAAPIALSNFQLIDGDLQLLRRAGTLEDLCWNAPWG
jgi:hypothetical protein